MEKQGMVEATQRRPVLLQPTTICGPDKGKSSMQLLRAALLPSVTHKIRAVTAMPLFKIDESSTLFSKS